MIKTQVMCDHCGAELRNYIGALWKASFLTVGPDRIEDLHACSKEHLAFAAAKALRIGVDGRCAGIITAKDLEVSDRDKRIADLEKQLVASNSGHEITEQTKPTKPLASAGAGELVEALDLALPEATCISCDDGPEKHRITVSVKWCNHSEVVAEYLPSLTGPKKPTKPARIAINPREVIEEPALESVFCECDRMVLPNGTIKHLPHCPLSEDS